MRAEEGPQVLASGQDAAPSAADVIRACGLTTLGVSPPIDAIESALNQLAQLAAGCDPLRLAVLREGAIAGLKQANVSAPASLVDTALLGSREQPRSAVPQGASMVLSEPSPWPSPVDGYALLEELRATFLRYMSLPPEADLLLALWVLHAYAHGSAVISPILAITSATKRCGKSLLLEILTRLVPRPVPTANVTPAALFRLIQAMYPTLLIDEADTFFPDRSELRGVLNSGHVRAMATVLRCTGDNHEARTFSTWCPKAIAGIGKLPDTIMDRSIEVRLKRRPAQDAVKPFRRDRLHELEPIRERCARWARDHLKALEESDPEIPSFLNDRAADNWRSLMAIAEEIGGECPDQTRKAARVLSGAPAHDGDPGEQLLADLLHVFNHLGDGPVPSASIVNILGAMESRPWPEWKRGQPITATQLAELLKGFDIAPRQHKVDGAKIRGYERSQFKDVWERYGLSAGPCNGSQG